MTKKKQLTNIIKAFINEKSICFDLMSCANKYSSKDGQKLQTHLKSLTSVIFEIIVEDVAWVYFTQKRLWPGKSRYDTSAREAGEI